MKIILTGGGTIGSVSPLLAVRSALLAIDKEAQFIWLGTEDGLEEEVIRQKNIAYFGIKCGKIRRYFSWQNFITPFSVLVGIFQSIKIIRDFKPDLILSAGSFVSVPVVIAAWLLRRRIVVHQQDIIPGLANEIVAKFATKVTVSFPESLKDFSATKAVLTGNPVRPEIFIGDAASADNKFGLEPGFPTLLVMGGSQGAERVNELIFSIVPELINFCQIIHVVGKGNMVEWTDRDRFGAVANRYHAMEYAYESLPDIYARAALVVCRAGLSTLTELVALGKPTIVVPIPHHQQEANAEYFNRKNAIIYFDQEKSSAAELRDIIEAMLKNPGSLSRLREYMQKVMPPAANENYVKLVREMIVPKS